MARRDKFTREMGELFNVVVDIMERSISGKYIYKKKKESTYPRKMIMRKDYAIDSRSFSTIPIEYFVYRIRKRLFLITKRSVHYEKVRIFKQKRRK